MYRRQVIPIAMAFGATLLLPHVVRAQSWYDSNWAYRKKITIDNTKVSTVSSTNLSNFPVLISRTDADLKDTANSGHAGQSDGGDILFTSADGTTKLDHEIESYDEAAGTLVAWVEIPTLSATVDTDIYIYYGYASAADQWNDSGTWDSNYKGVWHFDEAPPNGTAGHINSKGPGNHGTPQGFGGTGSDVGATGKIDGADQFDGVDDYVDCGTGCLVSGSWTVSFWLYPSSPGSYERIFVQGSDACGTRQLMMYWHTDHVEVRTTTGGSSGNPQAASGSISNGAWSHVTWTYNGSTHTLYVNGASSSGSTTGSGVGIGGDVYLGRRDTGNYWTGFLDEVRVSDSSRSADWIVTSYNNHNAPGTFFSVAAEENLLQLSDHDNGQEGNAFSGSGGDTDAELFAFKLDPDVLTPSVTQVVFRLTDIAGLVDGDWAGLELVVDGNDDGDIGVGESTTVGGAGSVNQAAGTITFSTSFNVTTATHYILRADFGSLSAGDTVTVSLAAGDITASESVSGATSSAGHAETLTVGPSTPGACGGDDCSFQSIQAAIAVSGPGELITIYRRTDDAANNECYDEHVTVDKAVTLQGASTVPASAACIGPASGGHIVTITASDVTLQNLHLSGRVNDGAGGPNGLGGGGRASGHGIYVNGDDIDNVQVINCSIDYTYGDNIRYYGDRDQDGNGFIEVKQCYLHHSDTQRNVRIIRGGGAAADTHIVRNNLIHTGKGVAVSGEADYVTIERNVIKGWPFWGHLGGAFPETRDGSHGGGWRYYSNCTAGIWVTDPDPSNLIIRNNLVIGGRAGIRVNTSGSIKNNTIVNPFNASQYDYNNTIDAADIRDNTYGIMLASGFSGAIQNNLVVVTADNRANGDPGQNVTTYYTPGITGYGIAFEGNSGTLGGGATISNNNVWGFVDTDGSTSLNYGSGITQGTTNLSLDPQFATDTADESNGGSSPCDADNEGTRCYELYDDNFFLSSMQTGGSCHADVVADVAGGVGFVDLSGAGAYDPDNDHFSGLGDCSFATDAADSRAIDFGSGALSSEPEKNGDAPNLGAFGGSTRASRSGQLSIVAIDVGDGGVKNGVAGAQLPGTVQPRADGLTQLSIYFNRAFSASSSSFEVRNYCDTQDLSAPTFDFGAAAVPPYAVTMTWTAGTFDDEGLLIRAFGDGVDRIVDLEDGDDLDGEISDLDNGTLPSGDDTAGGDAEFAVHVLAGDVDGDQAVEGVSGEHDYDAVTGTSGYPAGSCTDCPEDLDADGDVDADDLAVVTANDNAFVDTSCFIVDTTSDVNDGDTTDSASLLADPGPDGVVSLREALTAAADGETITFDTTVFPPGSPATIDVDGSLLPALDDNNVTVNASGAGVILADSDDDAPSGAGLTLSGTGNTIMGLQVKNFDKDGDSYGIHITGSGNTIGGVYNGGAANGLGQGCLISSNSHGIVIDGATATGNTVRGCLIGTNLAGTAADGNAIHGIYIHASASNNTIGGDRDNGHGNVISANGEKGIWLLDVGTDNNVIKGNYIGTDVTGSADLGNLDYGIYIEKASSTIIGSTTPGEENVIAYNIEHAIYGKKSEAEFNTWRGNIIYDNTAGSVFLSGANTDLDGPTVDTVSTTQVDGSGAEAGATIDVYTNTDGDDDCLVYVGSTTADGSGDWTLTGLSLTTGHYVVAIQTDTSGNSSTVSNDEVVP